MADTPKSVMNHIRKSSQLLLLPCIKEAGSYMEGNVSMLNIILKYNIKSKILDLDSLNYWQLAVFDCKPICSIFNRNENWGQRGAVLQRCNKTNE